MKDDPELQMNDDERTTHPSEEESNRTATKSSPSSWGL